MPVSLVATILTGLSGVKPERTEGNAEAEPDESFLDLIDSDAAEKLVPDVLSDLTFPSAAQPVEQSSPTAPEVADVDFDIDLAVRDGAPVLTDAAFAALLSGVPTSAYAPTRTVSVAEDAGVNPTVASREQRGGLESLLATSQAITPQIAVVSKEIPVLPRLGNILPQHAPRIPMEALQQAMNEQPAQPFSPALAHATDPVRPLAAPPKPSATTKTALEKDPPARATEEPPNLVNVSAPDLPPVRTQRKRTEVLPLEGKPLLPANSDFGLSSSSPQALQTTTPVAASDTNRTAPHHTLPEPPLVRHVAHQVAVAVTHTDNHSTEILLDPEELGRVKLSLQAGDAAIFVVIQTERPETTDLMRRHIDQLAQEFRSLGYQNVNFTFGDGHSAQGRGLPPPEAMMADQGNAFEADNQPAPLPFPQQPATSGHLDLRL